MWEVSVIWCRPRTRRRRMSAAQVGTRGCGGARCWVPRARQLRRAPDLATRLPRLPTSPRAPLTDLGRLGRRLAHRRQRHAPLLLLVEQLERVGHAAADAAGVGQAHLGLWGRAGVWACCGAGGGRGQGRRRQHAQARAEQGSWRCTAAGRGDEASEPAALGGCQHMRRVYAVPTHLVLGNGRDLLLGPLHAHVLAGVWVHGIVLLGRHLDAVTGVWFCGSAEEQVTGGDADVTWRMARDAATRPARACISRPRAAPTDPCPLQRRSACSAAPSARQRDLQPERVAASAPGSPTCRQEYNARLCARIMWVRAHCSLRSGLVTSVGSRWAAGSPIWPPVTVIAGTCCKIDRQDEVHPRDRRRGQRAGQGRDGQQHWRAVEELRAEGDQHQDW